MYLARSLVLSLLALLVTVWSLYHHERILRYVSNWDHNIRLRPERLFDARLHPKKHALRDPQTIQLDWVVRQELRAPDGVQKSIYTVNGLFPGPTIEARSGDRINLRVHNALEEETTAIHFHGIRQIGSNSMDGTPGLTQCAIPPKHSFLYNFTIANQTGTYWWHSHSLSQRADGLFGAFVIHDSYQNPRPPSQVDIGHSKEDLRIRASGVGQESDVGLTEKDLISERIILMGDWYHANATAMLKWYRSKKSAGFEPTPETALFNGVNAFDCSRASRFVHCDSSKGRIPSLSLDPHTKTRLRLVNTGSLADLEVSLSFHSLLVIEADGSPVVPRRVNSITVAPGQRYSVILEPFSSIEPSEGDLFWLRLKMSEECFMIPNAALDMEKFFRVFYGAAPTIDSSGPPEPFTSQPGLAEFNPLSLVPRHHSFLPPPDQQIMIYVNSMKLDRLGGIPYGYINQTSWVPEQKPLLLRAMENNNDSDWGKHQLVVTTHREAASVIELIVNNLDEGPHPLHLHGHHFYPLHIHRSVYGWGTYNYSASPSFPAEAPVLRDTIVVPRRGHVVIRFLADAPGMWLFHCHVLVHLSTGMAMTFNVRPMLVSPDDQQSARDGCNMPR